MSILLSAGLPTATPQTLSPTREWQAVEITKDYFQTLFSGDELLSAETAHFTVAELGFGFGERFIAIADAWLTKKNTFAATSETETPRRDREQPNHQLHYIAITDQPLTQCELTKALERRTLGSQRLKPPSQALQAALAEQLPPRLRGWHRLYFDHLPKDADEEKSEGEDTSDGTSDGIGKGAGEDAGQITTPRSSIILDLIYDDPERALGQLSGKIDCWHLETLPIPSENSEPVALGLLDVAASAIAKHSPQNRSCRIYAAPAAQEKLATTLSQKGYQAHQRGSSLVSKRYAKSHPEVHIEKISHKTTCLPPSTRTTPMRVAIIGAGLAGSAAALALARKGCLTTVFDGADSIAAGTSGNPIAALQGRYHRKSDHLGRWAQAGWLAADREILWLRKNGFSVDAERCGSLHLLENDEQAAALAEQLQLPSDVGQWLDATSASKKLGGFTQQPALWQPDAMRVNPLSLCNARLSAANAVLKLGEPIQQLNYEPAHENSEGQAQKHGKWHIANQKPFDAVILATGADTQAWLPWAGLQLARGQLTAIAAPHNEPPHCIVGYGGQLWPVHNGQRWFGSTADREPLHCELRDIDHATNIKRLQTALGSVLPTLNNDLKPIAGSAGVRSKTVDHMPLIGAIPDAANKDFAHTIPGLYLTAGLGARGIANSAIGAELLAAQITGSPLPMSSSMAAAVTPLRALQRWRKNSGLSPLAPVPVKSEECSSTVVQKITIKRHSA